MMRKRVTLRTRSGATIRFRAETVLVRQTAGQIVAYEATNVARSVHLLTVDPRDLEAVVVRSWWRFW